MKYVVTGGCGFIGSHVVDSLLDKGNVTILDRANPFTLGFLRSRAVVNFVDIANYESNNKILEVLKGVDCVFHLAALPSVPESIENPLKFNKVNVEGTLNMLELSRTAGVGRFVFSSSSSVYGNTEITPTTEASLLNPISPYALQKQIGEMYCRLYSEVYGLETVSLRYFNVYGEGMPTQGAYCNVIGAFSSAKKEGRPLKIFGDGSYRRDFTYVKNVAEANVLAATSSKVGKGECINIGTQTNHSIQEIADIFGGAIEYLPKRLEAAISLADNTKAKELLNWTPTTHIKDWLNENIHSRT